MGVSAAVWINRNQRDARPMFVRCRSAALVGQGSPFLRGEDDIRESCICDPERM